jgi:hypothetical protein
MKKEAEMPVNPTQPQITNNFGVVLTVGIVNNQDRCAIVLPIFTDATTIDNNDLCRDAVNSFVATVMGGLQILMSSDANISFVQGEGMIDGMAPYRQDYGTDDVPGTNSAGTLPSSCGTLIIWYQDTADETGPSRIKVAKTSVPGIPKAEFDGESISTGQQTSALTWANDLQNGWASVASTSSKWYRGLSTPKPRTEGVNIGRVNTTAVRGYVGTQRRRLVPH